MLSEGGMHVPFVISWPGTIPAGQVYDHPVSALDVAATAAELAHIETKAGELDGTNLVPHLTGKTKMAPHEVLTWRWTSQSAIREGNWKLLRGGDREYLYDLGADIEEKHNLVEKHPEIAQRLRAKLSAWADELDPPGLATGGMSKAATDYFDFYLDGKKPATIPSKVSPRSAPVTPVSDVPWVIRNGQLTQTDDGVQIRSSNANRKQSPFIARSGLKLAGPVSVRVVAKTTKAGAVGISWRTTNDKDFNATQRISVPIKAASDWQTVEATIPGGSPVIHVRLQVPDGVTVIKSLELKPADGKAVTLLSR